MSASIFRSVNAQVFAWSMPGGARNAMTRTKGRATGRRERALGSCPFPPPGKVSLISVTVSVAVAIPTAIAVPIAVAVAVCHSPLPLPFPFEPGAVSSLTESADSFPVIVSWSGLANAQPPPADPVSTSAAPSSNTVAESAARHERHRGAGPQCLDPVLHLPAAAPDVGDGVQGRQVGVVARGARRS